MRADLSPDPLQHAAAQARQARLSPSQSLRVLPPLLGPAARMPIFLASLSSTRSRTLLFNTKLSRNYRSFDSSFALAANQCHGATPLLLPHLLSSRHALLPCDPFFAPRGYGTFGLCQSLRGAQPSYFLNWKPCTQQPGLKASLLVSITPRLPKVDLLES